MKYPHIVRAISEMPWAIRESTLAVILDVVEFRAEGGQLSQEEIRARVGAASRAEQPSSSGTVAVLPLLGVLMPRANLFTEVSGGTSLERWSATFSQLVEDPNVGSIVLDVDSPGGSVEQVPEVAAQIRAAREQKTVVAVANTVAASAAYHLGSQASELVVTPSGMVGSIGVLTAHEDWSKFEERLGVTTTLISAGKFKTEANPFEPLSEEAREAIQEVVDDFYGLFVADVAKGRGTTAAAVREGFGQGRMVTAKKAVKEGMADRVDTLQGTVGRLLRPAGRRGARAASERRLEVELTGDMSQLDRALKDEEVSEGTEPSEGAEYVEGAERLLARPAVRQAQADV